MPLTTTEQAIQLLESSRQPLIVFKKDFSGDALGAALALALVFEKRHAEPTVVCADFKLPEKYRFLPTTTRVLSQLSSAKKFTISLPLGGKQIEEFSYDVVDDELKIFITPKEGAFGEKDIIVVPPHWDYDVIITLDTPNLDSLGALYAEHRDLFYEKPIVNIDASPANEQYGQINLIDLMAASTGGVVYELLKAWGDYDLDADINTCLLTGMVEKTKGFKTGLINPQTLRNASELIEKDARRDDVIRHLYYDRDVATLKLWGGILTRLSATAGNKIISATVTLEDFKTTNTATKNLPDVIDELISTVPGVEVIVVCYEKEHNKIGVLIKSLGTFDPTRHFSTHQPQGTKLLCKFVIDGNDLALAESTIVEDVAKAIAVS